MTGGWGTPSSWSLGSEPQPGQTFVQGKDQETARRLLDAAARVGVDVQEVRTVNGGFVVPDAVWDATQEQLAAETSGKF